MHAGGLLVDTECRVLDKDRQPIDGLFAIGLTSGGMFFNTYPHNLNCLSHTRNCLMGYTVGQVLGDRGVSFDNCRTEDIYIRYSYISASSGFIGNIGDGGINISWSAALEINNCTPASNVRYINDQDGGINTSYQPEPLLRPQERRGQGDDHPEP